MYPRYSGSYITTKQKVMSNAVSSALHNPLITITADGVSLVTLEPSPSGVLSVPMNLHRIEIRKNTVSAVITD